MLTRGLGLPGHVCCTPTLFLDHTEGLLCYAAIAERHEQNAEALGVLLRVVVAHQTHRGAKQLLAKVVLSTLASLTRSVILVT